jgi:2-polyprenyl-3-methyl-5-hydroxy-6-metoxy-1,4-benzoquinol methylase
LEKENHFWWNKAHKAMYDDFSKRFLVGQKGKLLDVGCGLGYFIKKISETPNWQAVGYEISGQAVHFAKHKLGLQNVFQGKVESSGFNEQSFDVITLWDVIEHIPNPDPLLSYLSKILKNHGMLFIHTPNIQIQLPKARIKKILFGIKSNKHYLEARDHINIYSPKTLKIVLQRNGFNKIQFIHLKPIQSVSGSKNLPLKYLKNVYFYFTKLLYILTFGKINIDNLFVITKK